jgi:hypothetical protein
MEFCDELQKCLEKCALQRGIIFFGISPKKFITVFLPPKLKRS